MDVFDLLELLVAMARWTVLGGVLLLFLVCILIVALVELGAKRIWRNSPWG